MQTRVTKTSSRNRWVSTYAEAHMIKLCNITYTRNLSLHRKLTWYTIIKCAITTPIVYTFKFVGYLTTGHTILTKLIEHPRKGFSYIKFSIFFFYKTRKCLQRKINFLRISIYSNYYRNATIGLKSTKYT